MKEVHIKLTVKDIQSHITVQYPLYRLHIDKSDLGKSDKEKQNFNLFAVARVNQNVKDLIVDLANNGYFLVEHKNGISIFEKFTTAEKFKHNLTTSNVQIFHDLFYTLDSPKIETKRPRLLVVFSSVADFSLNASISRRNFFTNFGTIGKYIPQNTYILRISDIGGVVGSFYMNNNFHKNVESNVQNLLKFILLQKNINKNDLVLYGVSKAGTAALYHSILGEYKSISVDPIVSDVYHERKYNDSHFTQGTFPSTKQNKFIDLMRRTTIHSSINILYSQNSPIYLDIITVIKNNDIKDKINYIHTNHPKIKDHPDVGPNTINILTMILNNLYYDFSAISSKKLEC